MIGINIPIRIGKATVMPGDVVLGRDGGVLFIPPQVAEQVVQYSEITHLRDLFGHQRLREGKYTAGQIDAALVRAHRGGFHRVAAGEHRQAAGGEGPDRGDPETSSTVRERWQEGNSMRTMWRVTRTQRADYRTDGVVLCLSR